MSASSSKLFSPSSEADFYRYAIMESYFNTPTARLPHAKATHCMYQKKEFFFMRKKQAVPLSSVKAHLSFDCKSEQKVLATAWDAIIPVLLKFSDITPQTKVVIFDKTISKNQEAKDFFANFMKTSSAPGYRHIESKMDLNNGALYQYEYKVEEVQRLYEKHLQEALQSHERFINGAHITIYFSKELEEKYDRHREFFIELNEALTKTTVPTASELPNSDFPVSLCPPASLRIQYDEKGDYVYSQDYNKFLHSTHPYFKEFVPSKMLVEPKPEGKKEEPPIEPGPRGKLVNVIDCYPYLLELFNAKSFIFWEQFNNKTLEAFFMDIHVAINTKPTRPKKEILACIMEVATAFCEKKLDPEIDKDLLEQFNHIKLFFETFSQKKWDQICIAINGLYKATKDIYNSHNSCPTL